MTEHEIQNAIRVELAKYGVIFRINVESGSTFDGRYISSGVPAGFSDLFGVRKCDGKAFFIEVKASNGKPSEKQLKFIKRMREVNAIAGICRSVDDAVKLMKGE